MCAHKVKTRVAEVTREMILKCSGIYKTGSEFMEH